MILIGQLDSPYVRRVAVSLIVLGLPFERRLLSVFRHAEEMRRFNPLGRVPALVLDDGTTLIDSAAILDYLDDLVGPDRALLPRSGDARRDALRIMALATGCIDKAMAIAYEHRRPRELMEASWIARCRSQLDAGLLAVDESAQPAGDRLMQPQITTAAALGYVRLRVPDALSSGRYRRLDAFAATCEALPAFKACVPTVEEIGGPDAEAALRRFLQPAGAGAA
jgi:glutathione S-transferase